METATGEDAEVIVEAGEGPARVIIPVNPPIQLKDKYIRGGAIVAGLELIEAQPETNTFVFSILDETGRRIGGRVLGAPATTPIAAMEGPELSMKAASDIWKEIRKWENYNPSEG